MIEAAVADAAAAIKMVEEADEAAAIKMAEEADEVAEMGEDEVMVVSVAVEDEVREDVVTSEATSEAALVVLEAAVEVLIAGEEDTGEDEVEGNSQTSRLSSSKSQSSWSIASCLLMLTLPGSNPVFLSPMLLLPSSRMRW